MDYLNPIRSSRAMSLSADPRTSCTHTRSPRPYPRSASLVSTFMYAKGHWLDLSPCYSKFSLYDSSSIIIIIAVTEHPDGSYMPCESYRNCQIFLVLSCPPRILSLTLSGKSLGHVLTKKCYPRTAVDPPQYEALCRTHRHYPQLSYLLTTELTCKYSISRHNIL